MVVSKTINTTISAEGWCKSCKNRVMFHAQLDTRSDEEEEEEEEEEGEGQADGEEISLLSSRG